MKLNPTFTKLAILAAVTLLLCYVLAEIGGLARERQSRQRDAAENVEQSFAGPQSLSGPMLTRYCRETWTVPGSDKKTATDTRDFWLFAAPRTLQVTGGMSPEVRHRGLFKVNTYASQLTMDAQWPQLASLEGKAEHANGQVDCEPVVAFVALSDTRGIRAAETVVSGQPLPVLPGGLHPDYASGLHAVLPGVRLDAPLALSLKLTLVGSRKLGLVPAAESTRVSLQSSWPHPSFFGQFLPTQHQVGVSGFSADWQVSSLASTAVADMKAGRPLPSLQAQDSDPLPAYHPTAKPANKPAMDVLAVELIDPVNPYVMSDRAIKYGLMFIALTFLTVGLTELLTGRRVHPVQYLFVGMALSLFFLLLLSLSEHLPFLVAYVIAAAAAAGVLTPYAAAMLGSWWRGAAFGGGIALLYGALYVLLSREQTALVIGAVLLFTVLAVVMTLTRRLDWYRLGGSVPAQG
ncbi:cell envelope integrity protein CreD [Roseateles puraquae]|jgi:inner membrane protein|uniref:cell envelope integrity protein CreD n=1 Tax=Roseateles puraquae TaxID=431059 RepID=UPI0031D7FF92